MVGTTQDGLTVSIRKRQEAKECATESKWEHSPVAAPPVGTTE